MTLDMRACEAASALLMPSLNAAAIRSSSISRSSEITCGSICTRFTSCLPFIVTFTMPPPDSPMTSMAAISSWAFFMLACSAIACFIMFPPPRIIVSSLLRGPHRLGVQRRAKTRLQVLDCGVILERPSRGFEGFDRTPLTVLGGRFDRRRPVDEFEFDRGAQVLRQCLHEFVDLCRRAG